MPCKAPIPAWQTPGGKVLFKHPGGSHRAAKHMQLPCGTCELCRKEQARQTAVRIYHESQYYAESSFLTLTYHDKHLPAHNSLNYEDVVKFNKRAWYKYGQWRYYAVGEYGDRTHRPHYHLCVFGQAFLENRIILRTSPTTLWTSPELIELWGLGNVSVGELNFATARYTANYITKKLRAKQKYVRVDQETGELIPLVQPRAFMSKNLGKSWWMQYHQQTIDHDHVIIEGKRQKPPRAYDRWLNEVRPATMEKIKERRKKLAETNAKSQEQLTARAANLTKIKTTI